MVTAGILLFRKNFHGRAGNRTRDLMISSQRLRPLDHEAGYIVNLNRCSHKSAATLSDFNETLNFLNRLSKTTQISNVMKIRQVGAEMFYVAERTDRQT